MSDLRHDELCGTYSTFHLLCQKCLRCVGFSHESEQPIPCPVCDDLGTEIYVRSTTDRYPLGSNDRRG